MDKTDVGFDATTFAQHFNQFKGEQPMNTNTATEYRNLPLAALTEYERNRDEVC